MFKVTERLMPARRAAMFTSVTLVVALSACSSSNDDPADTDSVDNSQDPGLGLPENPDNTSDPSPTINLVPQASAVNAVGTIYVDDEGHSLYTRYTDQPDTVTCVDDCAQTWPPLTTSVSDTGISGDFDVIARDDGTSQWTLLGYPLHRYSGDGAPGEVNGAAADEQWAPARPIPVTSADVNGDEALVAAGTTLADGTSESRVDRNNYTLYFFDNDTAGTSACNGGCANSWPPLYADTGAVSDGDRYTIIARDDGARQWAYQGKALYFWQGDSAAGEFTGADVANWRIARP